MAEFCPLDPMLSKMIVALDKCKTGVYRAFRNPQTVYIHPSSGLAHVLPRYIEIETEYSEVREMKLKRTLEVWKMGTINYTAALKLQERLFLERKAGKIPDTLLCLQHPPTYTLGKRRTYHNLLVPETDLKAMGAELHYTERGGDITFHGPRQAILYPIISLRNIGFGARNYVESLEATMINLSAIYGVKARRGNKCETGVWVGERKIGAIGVRISSGITSHGLAFNIDPDLNYFKHIVPCGIADKEVTSLQKETGVGLPSDEVIHEQLAQCFAKSLLYNDVKWRKDISSSYLDETN